MSLLPAAFCTFHAVVLSLAGFIPGAVIALLNVCAAVNVCATSRSAAVPVAGMVSV